VSVRPALFAGCLAACAAAAGCANTAQTTYPFVPGRLPDASAVSGAKTLLYASDYANGLVNIYDVRGTLQQPIAQFALRWGQPIGMATDGAGNLWIASEPEGVYEYPPGGTISSFSFDAFAPYDLAFGPTDMYLTDTTSPWISVYAPGQYEPLATIVNSAFHHVYGVAFDSKANLYVSYDDPAGRGRIRRYKAGGYPPGGDGEGVDLKLNPGTYYGIAVDAHDDLVVSNTYAPSIDVFPPGAHTPSQRFGRHGSPWFLTFDRSKTHLFVADYRDNVIDEYSYPSGKLIHTIPGNANGRFVGVAIGPAAPP
jgi:DNA-binding beta-propeller fold protein YncE